jgi:hypothetical protein
MPPINVKDSGTFKEASSVYVKDNGSWKEAQEVWAYDNGQWKLVHSAGLRISINTSTGYNSFTGITYGSNMTFTGTYQNSGDEHIVSVPSNALYLDFFMCGGGGGHGGAPSGSTDAWVGSGGGAAPILYGTVKIDQVATPSYLSLRVGRRGYGVNTAGEGAPGDGSSILVLNNNYSGRVIIQSPGGAPGRAADGKHKRALYQHGYIQVEVPVTLTTSGFNRFNYVDSAANVSSITTPTTGLASKTTVTDSTFGSNSRASIMIPIWYNGLQGTVNGLTSGLTSTVISNEDVADSSGTSGDPHKRNLVWAENSAWKFRQYPPSTNQFSVSSTVPPVPLYPDNVFTDSATSGYAEDFQMGMVLAEPAERATGYAGTFRGETNASGVPQNQTFTRTSGAQGTGTSCTGWSGGTPVRRGASNGSDYGKGADTGTLLSATGGIVQIRFRSS